MKCPKCDGKGFTELEHGLIMVSCPDCINGEIPDDNPSDDVLTVETLQKIGDIPPPELLNKEDMETIGQDSYIPPEAIESIELPKELEEALNDNSSDSGIGQPDKPAGSPNPSKPKQPKKPKAKRKASKRTG